MFNNDFKISLKSVLLEVRCFKFFWRSLRLIVYISFDVLSVFNDISLLLVFFSFGSITDY